MRRTKLLQVRLTEHEDKFIEQKMLEHGYKLENQKSEYVRDAVINPIRHDKKRQQDMLYQVNKIGVNLNQVIRRMHASGFISTELEAEISSVFIQLNEVLETYKNL